MGIITSEGDLAIRAMRDDPADYARVARWRSEPHVHEWWDPDEPAPTPENAAAQYGARARGEEPTVPCIIELAGRPIGYLQYYAWRSWPDADRELDIRADADTYGIDLFIGEPELIGRGLGTRVVDLICEHLRAGSARPPSRSPPRPRTSGHSAPTRRRASAGSARCSTPTPATAGVCGAG